jgi:hypothetical protein
MNLPFISKQPTELTRTSTESRKPTVLARVLDALDLVPMRRDDDRLWHKCRAPIFPKATVEGGWTEMRGTTWRRFTPSGWQYSQREAPFEEWANDQW